MCTEQECNRCRIYAFPVCKKTRKTMPAMILDTTSQTAISGKRLMPADSYRGRSSNASLSAGLLRVRRCEILDMSERIVFDAI